MSLVYIFSIAACVTPVLKWIRTQNHNSSHDCTARNWHKMERYKHTVIIERLFFCKVRAFASSLHILHVLSTVVLYFLDFERVFCRCGHGEIFGRSRCGYSWRGTSRFICSNKTEATGRRKWKRNKSLSCGESFGNRWDFLINFHSRESWLHISL